MKKNGTTKSGAQRWRCRVCGASVTHRIDNTAKLLKAFLVWLMGKHSLSEQSCSKATFERRAEMFWKLWPLSQPTGEVHDVLFVDGIYITRSLVVLIACTKRYVVAWHLAHCECSSSWAALLIKIAPPIMVVTDGGSGFTKAAKALWPNTKIQRCLVHVKRQVIRKTTTNPQLVCGQELLKIAEALPKVRCADTAAKWLANYAQWCSKWDHFLREFTLKDGRKQYVHERLRSARHSLNKLVKDKTLFTFVTMQEQRGGIWDSTNNVIEGKINAQIRNMLRAHRGLATMHRVKAVFWWCYLHSEFKVSEAEMLKTMPRDEDVKGLFALASSPEDRSSGVPAEFDNATPEWSELHKSE